MDPINRISRDMVSPPYLHAFKLIYQRLVDPPLNWALTGSFSHALQGVPVQVHDIDIQTDQTGAYEIERRLEEYVTQPVRMLSSDNIRSYLGAMFVEGIKIEVMGDLQKRLEEDVWEQLPDLESHTCWIDLEGMHIPVLDLEYEVQSYRRLGRLDRADLLRDWLASEKR